MTNKRRRTPSGKMTFGRYYPATSPVHRMDPRVKLTALLAYIIAALFCTNWPSIILLAVFCCAAFAAARIPLGVALRAWAPLSFIILLSVLADIFFIQSGDVVLSWGFIRITQGGLLEAARMGCRLSLMLFAACLLSLSTPIHELCEGLESMLAPFKRLGLPAHEISMVCGIALRFLPQLSDEFATVKAAQLSRGAKLASGSLKQRIHAYKALLTPLFAGAFRHADTLADAMEARCYHGGEGRTRLDQPVLSRLDAYCALLMLALIAGIIAARLLG